LEYSGRRQPCQENLSGSFMEEFTPSKARGFPAGRVWF
jgi:hypothetical protein